MAVIGVTTGLGFYQLTKMEKSERETVYINGKEILVTSGRLGDHEIVHLRRYGNSGKVLPHEVSYLENMMVMAEKDVDMVIGTTIAAAIDPKMLPGVPILFDDLYFPENRLPDGRPCTVFDSGDKSRPKGIFLWENVFSSSLRGELARVLREKGMDFVEEGTYADFAGPRAPTPSEVKVYQTAGVTALAPTAGPEPVLAAELGLPYALIGFTFAGPMPEAFHPQVIRELLAQVPDTFSEIITSFVKEGNLEAVTFDQGALFWPE